MATITYSESTTFQTISWGWFCESIAGLIWDIDTSPGKPPRNPDFENYIDTAISNAIDVGYNAIALAAHAGYENPTAYWYEWAILETRPRTGATGYKPNRRTTSNADQNPATVLTTGNGTGSFQVQIGELDYMIEHVVEPFRQAVQANDETPYVIMKYESFTGTDSGHVWHTSYFHHNPDLYARYVHAIYKHIHDTWGWYPDAWEMMIEPDFDNLFYNEYNGIGATRLAANLKAAGDRLAAAGMPTNFIFGSPTDAGALDNYYDDVLALSGANQYVAALGYHRYGGTTADITGIGSLATSNGKGAGLTEWEVTSPQDAIYEDLTVGKNTFWGLGNPLVDLTSVPYVVSMVSYGNESTYPGVDYPTRQSGPTLSYQSKLLKRYMKNIRPGATRVAATSDDGNFKSTGWRNFDGKSVVVIQAATSGSIVVSGLPANTYSIKYSKTDGFADEVSLSNQTITAPTGSVSFSVPAAAWITVAALNSTTGATSEHSPIRNK